MVMDTVLSLKAQPVIEGELAVHLPVVLIKERCIEQGRPGTEVGNLRDASLRWCAGGVRRRAIEVVVPVGAGIRIVRFAIRAQPGAEAQRMVLEAAGQLILQLVVVAAGTRSAIIAATAGEGTLHGQCRGRVLRQLLIPIAFVLKTRVVHQVRIDHLGIADLN